MSWSTELFTNISFNRETFNSIHEVEAKIDELNACIKACKETLRDLAIMTEPQKYMNSEDDGNPYNFVSQVFTSNMELLHEYIIEKYKLELLFNVWDDCHKDGLAINPPKGINYKTSFLEGDFVRGTEYTESTEEDE